MNILVVLLEPIWDPLDVVDVVFVLIAIGGVYPDAYRTPNRMVAL